MTCPCGTHLDKRNTSGLCRSCNGRGTIKRNSVYERKGPQGVPAEAMADYLFLSRIKRIPAAEARRMVMGV